MTDSLSSPTGTGWVTFMQAVEGDWSRNGLVFPDSESADAYGRELHSRWMGCKAWRVEAVDEEPNRPSTLPTSWSK